MAARVAVTRMGIVTGNLVAGRRIAQAAGTFFNLEHDQCIARFEDGVLYGGVTYTGYSGCSIQGHMAGFVPNWINRDFLWVAFHYPFVQLGVDRVFAQVPESNKRALEINMKLGFKLVAKIEGVYPTGACCVLEMQKSGCRWLQITPRRVVAGS